MTPEQQSEIDRSEFANTVRLQKAQNGFIIKTKAGPMIFLTLKDAFVFLEKFFK